MISVKRTSAMLSNVYLKFFSPWHVGLTEARKVRRNHKKSVGEQRDQITKHVARGREAEQQQQFRCIVWPRSTKEDLYAVTETFSLSSLVREAM